MTTAIHANPTAHEPNPTIASPQLYARLAGVLYLLITVAAVIAHIYMPAQLIVPDDAAATVTNINANPQFFMLGGIGGELVVLLSEVILSVLLYMLLKPVNQTLSLLAAVSRLMMTAVHGVNLLNYVFVLLLLNPAYQAAFEPQQVNTLVTIFLEAHSYGFTVGIAFLVIHVLPLGYLIYRSGYLPRWIGVLFIIAGFGYLIDAIGLLFLSNYQTTPGLVALAIAASEIVFPLWLLIRGVDMQRWQEEQR